MNKTLEIIHRKHIEDALYESNQFKNRIIQSIQEGIIVYGLDQKYLVWNTFMEKLFGITASEVIGKHPLDLFPFVKDAGIIENLNKVLNGQIIDGFGYQYNVPGSGKAGWAIETIKPLMNDFGEIIGAVSTLLDITDSKKASEALIDAELLYHDLYNNTPTMFMSVEHKTNKVIECNETLLKKTGFNRDEVIGQQIFMRYHPDSLEKAKSKLEIFNKTGEISNSEIDLLTKLGGKIPVLINATAVRDENGKIMYSRKVLQDISGLRQVQEELSQSEERYRAVAETAIDSIITIDDIGIIVGWNQGATHTFGYGEHEIFGNSISMIIPDNYSNGHSEGFKGIKEGKGLNLIGKTIEMAGKRKNGEIFPIELSLAKWQTANDHFFTGIIRDITKRKLVENALQNSQEQLKKFAAHLQSIREEERISLAREIHDELGQILSAIKIDIGLFMQKITRNNVLPTSELLLDEIDNIYKLVDKTIITARKIMSELRPEVLDTIGFVEAVKSFSMEFQQRYHINCTFESDFSKLKINPQQSIALFRICQESLSNVARHAEATEVTIKLQKADNKLIIKIIDNGKGIDDQQKARTDSYGIIGMRERVFLLEGELCLISHPGEGTTVKIEIPYFNK